MIELLKNVTQDEARTAAKKRRGRILLNREIDSLIQQGILNPSIFPLWTGTHVAYKGTEGIVTEDGKKTKIKLPEESGWYKPDKFGIPSGKPSNEDDQSARCFWRLSENECLLVRWVDFGGYYRRGVDALCRPSVRLEVLIESPSGAKKIKK